MKKLLIFVLVLGMASMASATPYLQVNPTDWKDHYTPSDWITIDLVSPTQDLPVIGFAIDAITDGGGGGAAAEPQVFNASFTTTFPGKLNTDGLLVKYVAANDLTIPARGATGILYSFEYHVPDVPFSTVIHISTFNDGGDLYYPAELDYRGGTSYVAPPELGVMIHVVPEPATIALLGLGGLLLRRRK